MLEQELVTALVHYLVPPGTKGDPSKAALAMLDGIDPKDRVSLRNTDAASARCEQCGQTFMGFASQVDVGVEGEQLILLHLLTVVTTLQGEAKLDLAENVYCMGCRKPSMKLFHNLKEHEIRSFKRLLKDTPIKAFCGTEEQVSVLSYEKCGLNTAL